MQAFASYTINLLKVNYFKNFNHYLTFIFKGRLTSDRARMRSRKTEATSSQSGSPFVLFLPRSAIMVSELTYTDSKVK